MNIGIDIDNTITNTRETIMKTAECFNREQNISSQFDLSYYNLDKSLGWDNTTTQLFLKKHLTEIYRQVQPKPHSLEIIRELHENHRIILITSRNQNNDEIEAITQSWLQSHEVPYDKLVMNRSENMHYHSKLADCLENSVELMIEDHHDLARELSDYFPVILFDYPYNVQLKRDNIFRVQSWLEVRDMINQLQAETAKAVNR